MTQRAATRLGGTVVLLALITCGGLDTFDVEESATTTIQGAGVLGVALNQALGFTGFDNIDISDSNEFENQGVTKDDVDSVKVQAITLRVTSPTNGNFDFLESIEFYVDAAGLPKKLIALRDNIPDGQSEIELDVRDIELRDYVVKDAMSITAQGSGEVPVDDTTIKADVVMAVDVNVDGVLCGG
jgi:hypothetical protein